jgi:hypothetical protein
LNDLNADNSEKGTTKHLAQLPKKENIPKEEGKLSA